MGTKHSLWHWESRGRRSWFALVLLILTILWCLPPSQVLAEEPTEAEKEEEGQAIEKLEEIVVTATRTEREVENVPASVTVITREEIEKTPAQFADELLQSVAGVYVRHTSGFNTASTGNKICMRGIGGTSEATVLVLRDGVPVHDTQNLGVEWNEFSIQDIERIEVVRGPAAALYGSNAMGGVINVITKKPEEGFKTELEGGYGSLDTYRVGLRHSGTVGKFGYSIAGSRLDTGGYVETPPEDVTPLTSDDVSSEKNNFSGKLSYEIDPTSSITYAGSFYQNRETGKYTQIDDFNCFSQDIFRSSLNYRKKWENLDLQMTVYGSNATSSYESALSPDYTRVSYEKKGYFSDFGANLQGSFPLGQHNYITVGGEFRRGWMDTEFDYKTTVQEQDSGGNQDVYSIFAQDEINLFDEKLIVTLGGRFDCWRSFDGNAYNTDVSPDREEYDEAVDWAFNPRVGVLFHVCDNVALRGAFGRAFTAPDLTSLYRGEWKLGSRNYKSNPDLGPEDVLSYEFGIDFKLEDRLTVRTTYYRSYAEDFIYRISPAPNYYEYRNVGEVEIEGVEMEANFRANEHLRLMANLTLNNSKIEEFKEDTSLEGKFLTRLPKEQAGFRIIYDNPKYLTVMFTGRQVGTIYDDDANTKKAGDYCTADIRVSRKITDFMEAALDVYDIADGKYQDTTSYITPGRVFMGSVRFTF